MVVLREADALTLIHPVRLSAEGETALDQLGAAPQRVFPPPLKGRHEALGSVEDKVEPG